MARINLLPWREELRQERKKQFGYAMAAVALAAILSLFMIDLYENARIDEQRRRNAYLQTNIAELDAQVAEIRELERRRTELLDRMRVIQQLQGNRPIIVRIIDQLVRTVPDGVFYTSLETKDGRITVEGVAESSNRVSSLMRNLDASDWLEQPNLDAVRAAPEYGEQATTFNLTVQIDLPDVGEGDEA